MDTPVDNVGRFFWFARERHAIYLRRAAGQPRASWTTDLVLQRYRFTNVFRELDATTVWFRRNVRDPMRDSPNVLLATVLFRWFNRVSTGEAIFLQPALGLGDELPGETAWQAFNRLLETGPLRAAIRQYCGDGPWVTGSYIIKTPDGMDKLDGVLQCVEWFVRQSAESPPDWSSLEAAHRWLRQFPYLGDFMAYEIVTDLRHTALLDSAPDIMTWANPGPGAVRGLNRIHGRPLKYALRREKAVREMRDLLALSRDRYHWPQEIMPDVMHGSHRYEDQIGLSDLVRGEWPYWEMRDVEHTLCEHDKWLRATLGEGRPRQVFR